MTTANNEKKRIYSGFLSGMVWRTIAEFLVRIRSIILLPILTRLFGQVEYGIWTQISTTTSMLSTIGDFGIGAAMRRFLPGLPPKELQKQFWMSISLVLLGTTVIATPVLFFQKDIAAAFFGGEENSIFVLPGVFLMFSKVIQAHLIIFFRLTLRFRTFSFLLVLNSLVSLLGYLAAALIGRDLLLLAITAVGIDAIVTLLILVLVIRTLGFSKPDFSQLKRFLTFGLPSLPRSFLSWALNSADRYFIAYYLGTGVLAVYAVAYGIALWPIMIVMTPVWAVMPASANTLWNNNQKKEAIQLLGKTFQYSFAVAIPVACITVFWGGFILEIYAGAAYAEGSKVLGYVVLAYLLHFMSGFYRFSFDWNEKTKVYLLTFSISVAVSFALNFYLVPIYGYLGSAIATLASFGSLVSLEIVLSRKYMRLNLPIRSTMWSALIGLVLAYLFSMQRPSGWPSFIFQVSGFLIAYAATILAFRIIRIPELIALFQTLRKKQT